MNNWKKLEQYRKLYLFIGKRSTQLLIVGVAAGIALFATEVTFAYLLQAFLVMIKVVPSSSNMNFPSWLPVDNILSFLIFVSFVVALRGLLRWFYFYLNGMSIEVQRNFQRRRLIEWVFSSKSISAVEFTNLYTGGIDSVCSNLSSMQNIALMLSTACLIFAYLFKISVVITLISIAILSLLALITRKLDIRIIELGQKAKFHNEQINKTVMANIKNLLLLQIYGTQQKEKEKAVNSLDSILSNSFVFQRILNMKSAVPHTLGVIMIISLCVYSTQNGLIPSGLMITYFYLFLQFVQSFSDVIKMISGITFNLQTTNKFAKWWADHSFDGIRNRFNPIQYHQVKPISSPCGWEFNGVTFRYDDKSKAIFHNFNMKILPQTCTVLVGGSGSGKSTIISLALGLLDATQGQVNLNTTEGLVPIANTKEKLLKSVGYVGPESFLIEGTIEDNLYYGLDSVPTESETLLALKMAECGFVHSLPNGLKHWITDQGQGLSAGQKQRISFARALLRNPKVLILDEATSNLDSETEEKIVQTLSQLKGTVTILAVSHREKILKIADQVIKLD
jgi:ABC-type multidrug transport system fused ATPase/permease subunit